MNSKTKKNIIMVSFVLITQSLWLEWFISPVSLTHCIAFFYLNPNVQFNMSPEVDLMETDSLSIFISSLFLKCSFGLSHELSFISSGAFALAFLVLCLCDLWWTLSCEAVWWLLLLLLRFRSFSVLLSSSMFLSVGIYDSICRVSMCP